MHKVITSHSADPDGVICAALFVERARQEDWDYELGFADYPDLTEMTQRLSDRKGEVLYFSDLTFFDRKVPDRIVEKMTGDNEVHYFDHHGLKSKDREDLLRQRCKTFAYTTADYCAAYLVLRSLGLSKSPKHKFLGRVAQSMDFRGTLESETEALGRELNWAIRPESGLGLAEIVDALVEDRWYQDGHLIGDLRVAYLLTEKMAQDAPEVVRSTTSYHQVGDLSVVCARVPQILYMKQGMDLVQGDNPRGDVYLIFFESSSFIANQTRHPDEKRVPVLPFVRSKGGNGRGNGGGLNFPIPTDAKNYESVRDRLLGEFQEFLSHPEVIARWYSE